MSFSSQFPLVLAGVGLFTSPGFFLTSATAQMAPGGFGGAMGGVNGTTSVGATTGGGGRGAVVPSGGRAGVNSGGVGGAQVANRGGSQPGARYGVPATGSQNRTYAPGVSNNGGFTRPNLAPPQPITRVNNLWTQSGVASLRPGVINAHLASTTIQRRNLPYYQPNTGLSAANSPYVRDGFTGQNGSSTRLYPGSFGYNSRNSNGGLHPGTGDPNSDNGNHEYHRHHDHCLYYPYFNYGYYYPFAGGFGYYGSGANFDSGYGYTANGGVPYAAPDPATYDEGGQPMTENGGGNSSVVAPPGAVRIEPPLWSRGPEGNREETVRPRGSLGPDSLVEAVQTELANRGYFKGKVDAMFRDDTKESIRKFQADNHLAVTGLLNNATLTMLGLD